MGRFSPVVEGRPLYHATPYTVSSVVLVRVGRRTGHASFSRETVGKYARHVYYTYNSQLYTPVVYKDVKRRGCTRPRFHVPPPSGEPPLNNAITQELWQLNDTLCIIIRLRYRSLGHSVLRGSRVVGPPPLIPNKSRFALRRVISSAILLSRYALRSPICRNDSSIDLCF